MTHSYLSTACLHAAMDRRPELHAECQITAPRYDGGTKVGGQCKWCPARCRCGCHDAKSDAGRQR